MLAATLTATNAWSAGFSLRHAAAPRSRVSAPHCTGAEYEYEDTSFYEDKVCNALRLTCFLLHSLLFFFCFLIVTPPL